MGRRRFLASMVTVGVLAAFSALAADADAATLGPSLSTLRDSARTNANVIEIRHRHLAHRRVVRLIHPRISPSYLAYDYPYYDSRGHYPTHIRPGYVSNGNFYVYERR